MKTTILKSVMMMLVALFSLNANAYDVVIDGIYYNLNKTDNTASVTYQSYKNYKYINDYEGIADIPSSIRYDDATYNVTSIGDHAFEGCIGLQSIIIPNSITEIGHAAFWKCSSLLSVTIPNSVTSIKKSAFQDCSGLTSVTIPNSVTSIGGSAFLGCSGLTSVTIPNSLTSIDENAFRGCSGLASVTIPNSVTSIGPGAFENCHLTSVIIPNSVTSIGDYAFANCSGLASVTIPNSVTFIGGGAFYGTKWLKNQEDGVVYAGNVVYMYKGTMPENTSIIIKEGTKSISASAFKNCSDLSSVTIPNSVTSIGSEAFYGCSGLTSVNIPEGVTVIEYDVFHGCSSLTSVNIPNNVAEIGQDAFYGTKWLEDQEDGVVYAGNVVYMYKGTMPENTNIIIKEGTKSISASAFKDCSGLSSVTIPNSVTSIGREAFSGCSGLTSVNIPESVTVIEYDVFRGCSSLTSVVIPDGVTSIWDNAWGECSALTSITIPEGVTSISDGAFYGCSSLTSVTIPSSVTNTGIDVFSGCNNLTDVYSYMLTLPITSDGAPVFALGFFDYVPLENVTLHVPESSIDVYKKTEPWSGFGKIVAINASKHMFTYMVDGKEYKTYEIETGTAITAEKEPTKEGYTFSGWSVIPATMPAKDVTVAGTFTVNKYKLIYMVDGETYKTVEVEYEATITAENEPTKEGYTFSGWGEIPATMPAKDLTVKGTFTINKYKLTYMVDGETYKTAEVEFGTPITIEDEPTKEGYTFSGWSMIPATMPAKDVTITGSFTKGQYQLTYIVDGKNYKTIRMDYGDDITAEDEPTKEGYTFSGWSEIPATMPNKDVTVTGSFIINKYTLTYKVDDEVYKTLDVDYGKSITAEKEPEKKGYTFSGWSEIPATMPAKDVTVTGSFTRNILTPSYKRNLSSQTTAVSSIIIGSFVQKSVGFNLSNNGTESINVTKLVVKNPDNNYSVVSTSTDASLLGKLDGGNSIGLSVNLNADFTPCYEWHYTYKGKEYVFCSDEKDPANKHDITYYVDDEVYVTYEPEVGEEILPEADPSKEHYTFSGWSEVPATMPNNDVTVKGTFIADKYTLTYVVDGETYKTVTVNYGDAITPEAQPTKEGYTFSGWSEIPVTMPAKDVTITGNFTLIDAIEDVIADDSTYQIYTIDGKPIEALQKGVNIIKYQNGNVKKVLVK